MIESKIERDLSLILKYLDIDFDGEMLNGEEAFKKLVIWDMLGKTYTYRIDWNKDPIEIKTFILMREV